MTGNREKIADPYPLYVVVSVQAWRRLKRYLVGKKKSVSWYIRGCIDRYKEIVSLLEI